MNTIIDTNVGEIVTIVDSESIIAVTTESPITIVEAQSPTNNIEVLETNIEINDTSQVSNITLIEPFTEIILVQEAEQVLTFTDIGVQGINGITPSIAIFEIMSMYKNSVSTYYTEYTRDVGNISEINVWTDATKLTKLFEKTIMYVEGSVVGYTIKDLLNLKILNVSYEFGVEGNIINKTAMIN